MLKRYETKSNHPLLGKKHRTDSLALISKPGELNLMFGKLHSSTTKEKISDKISKHIDGIGIYDLNDNLIYKFKNKVELAKHLNIYRVTVGKYLNSGLVYKKCIIFFLTINRLYCMYSLFLYIDFGIRTC